MIAGIKNKLIDFVGLFHTRINFCHLSEENSARLKFLEKIGYELSINFSFKSQLSNVLDDSGGDLKAPLSAKAGERTLFQLGHSTRANKN